MIKTKDKYFIFTIVVIGFVIEGLFVVQEKYEKEPEKVQIRTTKFPFWKNDLDTILEKNNPKNLDLSKHQLFIDTTRNSETYERLINWKPSQMDNDAFSYYEKEIAEKHKPIKVELKDFPRHWIGLKKLDREFVIYDPCDGNTIAYQINESSVIFFYQLETNADLIAALKRIGDNQIELE